MGRLVNWSLKVKLIVSLTIVLFFSFLLTNILNYTVSRDTIRRTIIQNTLPATGNNIYSEIQKDLMRPIFIASLMANDTFLKDWVISGEADVDALTRYLEEIRSRYGFFTTFFVSEKTGFYYAYKGIHKRISPQDEHDVWYYQFRSSGVEYDLDVDTDEVSANTLTVFINHRLNDYRNGLLGVTGVGLNMDHLGSLLVSYKRQFERNIYLVDPEGTIQVYPDPEWVEDRNIRRLSGIAGVADQILAEREEPQTVRFIRDGEHVLLESRYIPELEWFLLVEQSEDVLMAGIRYNLFRNLLFGFFISCLVILINYFTVNHFQKKLEALALTDGLSGAANRREFDRRVEQALSLAARQQVPLSVALFDIDGFKEVNDRYGHLQGDAVIRRVADIAQSCLRKSDLLVRWGGDEFSILTHSSVDEAQMVMERIRDAVAGGAGVPDAAGQAQTPVTISCGLDGYRQGDTPETLVARVDRALYAAKAQGKNRVVVAGNLETQL